MNNILSGETHFNVTLFSSCPSLRFWIFVTVIDDIAIQRKGSTLTVTMQTLGKFILRSLILGIEYGALLGFLFNVIEFRFATGGVLGFVVGGLGGAGLGLLNGIILGCVSVVYFPSEFDEKKYRNIMLVSSASITAIGASIVFPVFWNFLFQSLRGFWIYGIQIVLVAAVAAGYASQKLSTWYIERACSSLAGKRADENAL